MVYYNASVDIDVDLDDILRGMGHTDTVNLVAEMLADGYVPKGWQQSPEPNLSDPADRLAVITELRKLGYTVEPGGK